jgi:hypothetical protein
MAGCVLPLPLRLLFGAHFTGWPISLPHGMAVPIPCNLLELAGCRIKEGVSSSTA